MKQGTLFMPDRDTPASLHIAAHSREARPLHVAIIMDGNGRWATGRELGRSAGHRAGGDAVHRIVEAAPALGIGALTLYAFSAENWRRPAAEVSALLALFQRYLRLETRRCVEEGVRVSVIGRRDRLPALLRAAIERTEAATLAGGRLHLRLAIDYSASAALERAAAAAARHGREPVDFRALLAEVLGSGEPVPDVDLLIRTGGEQRLSDFLLLECAWAELYFTPVQWPDFDAAALAGALAAFERRERRFGGLEAVRRGAPDVRP
jgi:undecaprenyl diphosphate synthase